MGPDVDALITPYKYTGKYKIGTNILRKNMKKEQLQWYSVSILNICNNCPRLV
jgi:hypothetical protein